MEFYPEILLSKNSMQHRGFTLVEVLIAILIFGLGLISAYTLINAASALSTRSKQEIIATNLLREQIELIKNIRDTNYLALRSYDSLRGVDPTCSGAACKIPFGYATVSPQFRNGESPIVFHSGIFNGPSGGPNWNTPAPNAHKSLILTEAAKSLSTSQFRYCIDTQGRYRQDCAGAGVSPTPYYGFILIRPIKTSMSSAADFIVPGALSVTAYFITTEGGYREMSIATILTDFKK